MGPEGVTVPEKNVMKGQKLENAKKWKRQK